MKEPIGSKSYILNTSRIFESDIELAGERALNLSHLAKIGAPVPSGFVITSKVFDDFLFANNLIAQISEINSYLVRGRIDARKAQSLIQTLIMKGNFPNLILEMLYRAYNLLVADKTVSLSLLSSALNPQLKESLVKIEDKLVIATDFDDFLIKIKKVWLYLFKDEVLEYRINSKYKGVISTAIVVNKFVQPDVSGTAYTLSVDNANPDIVELRAVYGIEHNAVYKENFMDRYLYQRSTEQLLTKTVNKQSWMLVLKNTKLEKLPLAQTRQKGQKLNDVQIMSLAKISSNLKSHFKNELKIDWQFQAGKFTFTNLARLREQEILDARKFLSPSEQSTKQKKSAAVIANPIDEHFHLQPLDKLTKVLYGNGNNKGIIYGRIRLIRSNADLQKVQGVNILVLKKPLRNMGLKQVRYRGLIIETNFDANSLELPVISGATDASSLLLENEIITLDTNTGNIYLGAGYVPVAAPVAEKIVDKFRPETVNAKEITVTMQRPVTGGIFKARVPQPISQNQDWLPQQLPEPQELAQPQEWQNPQELRDLHHQQKLQQPQLQQGGGSQQPQKSQQRQKSQQEEIQELSKSQELARPQTRQIDDEWYLKPPVYKDLLKNLESGSEYWQIINPENPLVLEKTNGVYYKVSEILKILDVDPYELIRNKPLQRKFVEFCALYLEQFKSSQQILLVLDIGANAKETLSEEGLLDLQIDIVKHLRNKLGLRNVSVILPDIRNEKELASMKKLITANGLRRSATFGVYCELASPLAVISVQKIINDGTDGLILDLDKLLINLAAEDNYRLSPEITEFITEVIEKISTTTVPLYLLADGVSLTDDNIEKLIESGLIRFIFPEAKIKELSPILANIEVKLLTKKPAKKGRKKKSINYGY